MIVHKRHWQAGNTVLSCPMLS